MYENKALVWVMTVRQYPLDAEYADLHQEASIGLWQAVLHFDPARGIRFSTYACASIMHRVWLIAKRSRRAEGWLEAKRAGDSLELLLRVWQAEQIHQALAEELATLPERWRRVLELHYGLSGEPPQKLSDIGKEWGISRERMRQLKEKGLALLRLPAFSVQLRTICERQERRHYRQALRENQSRQRKLRGRR